MNIIYDCQKALNNLQANTIGLFKPNMSSVIELVIENDRGLLKCVSFGTLGGLHTIHISQEQGKLHMFEEGKYLSDIMEKPFEFDTLLKSL